MENAFQKEGKLLLGCVPLISMILLSLTTELFMSHVIIQGSQHLAEPPGLTLHLWPGAEDPRGGSRLPRGKHFTFLCVFFFVFSVLVYVLLCAVLVTPTWKVLPNVLITWLITGPTAFEDVFEQLLELCKALFSPFCRAHPRRTTCFRPCEGQQKHYIVCGDTPFIYDNRAKSTCLSVRWLYTHTRAPARTHTHRHTNKNRAWDN